MAAIDMEEVCDAIGESDLEKFDAPIAAGVALIYCASASAADKSRHQGR